jgi:hypothetical protein
LEGVEKVHSEALADVSDYCIGKTLSVSALRIKAG